MKTLDAADRLRVVDLIEFVTEFSASEPTGTTSRSIPQVAAGSSGYGGRIAAVEICGDCAANTCVGESPMMAG